MEEKENPGDASKSLNGYTYQRLYTIYKFLTNEKYEYIKEEGKEDTDLYNKITNLYDNNDKTTVVQNKYHHTLKRKDKIDDSESFSKSSGLFKVIKRHIKNHKDIEEIHYIASVGDDNRDVNCDPFRIFRDNKYILGEIFDNKYYVNLGKFLLILLSGNTSRISWIKDEKKLNEEITTLKIKDNEKIKDIYNEYHNNYENCKSFFSKFKFIKGPSYKDLMNKIENKVAEKFDIKINTPLCELRLGAAFSKIFTILMETSFENNNRELRIKQIEIDVKNVIELSNNDLIEEVVINIKNRINGNVNKEENTSYIQDIFKRIPEENKHLIVREYLIYISKKNDNINYEKMVLYVTNFIINTIQDNEFTDYKSVINKLNQMFNFVISENPKFNFKWKRLYSLLYVNEKE